MGFRVQGVRVQGAGFRVQGEGCRLRIQGTGFSSGFASYDCTAAGIGIASIWDFLGLITVFMIEVVFFPVGS